MKALQGGSPRIGAATRVGPTQGGAPILPGQYPAPYTPVFARQEAEPFDPTVMMSMIMTIMMMGIMVSMMKGIMTQIE